MTDLLLLAAHLFHSLGLFFQHPGAELVFMELVHFLQGVDPLAPLGGADFEPVKRFQLDCGFLILQSGIALL